MEETKKKEYYCRKLSFYDSNPVGNCKHELCNSCFEELSKMQPAGKFETFIN